MKKKMIENWTKHFFSFIFSIQCNEMSIKNPHWHQYIEWKSKTQHQLLNNIFKKIFKLKYIECAWWVHHWPITKVEWDRCREASAKREWIVCERKQKRGETDELNACSKNKNGKNIQINEKKFGVKKSKYIKRRIRKANSNHLATQMKTNIIQLWRLLSIYSSIVCLCVCVCVLF